MKNRAIMKILVMLTAFTLLLQPVYSYPAHASEPDAAEAVGASGEYVRPEQPEQADGDPVVGESELPLLPDEEVEEEIADVPEEESILGLSISLFALPRDVKEIFAENGYPTQDQTIVQNFGLTFTDNNGNAVTEPNIDSKLNFDFDLKVPQDVAEKIQPGDYYDIQLPNDVKINRGLPAQPLEDPVTGEVYATYTVSTDGLVHIVFADGVLDSGELTGSIFFQGVFNRDVIDTPGDHDITIPGESKLPPVHIVIKPRTQSSIDKNGNFDTPYNPGKILWQVDVNKAQDTHSNAVVTENFPTSLGLSSVEVYTIDVDLDGNVVESSMAPADPSLYTIDYTTGQVTFNQPIDSAYRIVYDTHIADAAKPFLGGTMVFPNTANLNSTEISAETPDGINAGASLTARFGTLLQKNSAGYNAATQTMNWTVQYNYEGQTIPPANAAVYDSWTDTDVIYVPDSLKVYRVVLDSSGNVSSYQPLTAGSDYSLALSAQNMGITFPNGVNYPVYMTYSTKVDGIIDTDRTHVNTVETIPPGGTPVTSHGTVTIRQQGLVKWVQNVDYDNKTITWAIDVNGNRDTMYNWTMTDVLELELGQTLDDVSLQIYDKQTGQNLVQTTDPLSTTADYNFLRNSAANHDGFLIQFLNGYKATDHSFRITYKTTYDTSDLIGNGSKVYRNVAGSFWTETQDPSSTEHTSSGNAAFKPITPDIQNGKKAGSYNAITKEITWAVQVNFARLGMQSATLTDPIGAGQQYVSGSVQIFHYTINPATGAPVKGAQLTPTEYSAFSVQEPTTADNALHVAFPDAPPNDDALYWVEFRTSLENSLISASYNNTATFQSAPGESFTLTATVGVANGGQRVKKDGQQGEDGYAWWTVTINPEQSTLYDVVITDTPSDNQKIDLDSISIVGTTVNQAGAVTADPSNPLVKGTDYTAEYSLNSTGKWVLTITLLNPNPITRAYILKYRASLFVDPANPAVASNSLILTANNKTVVTPPFNKTIPIDVNKGGGTLVGTKAALVIQKQNPNSENLSGAVFQLYDRNGLPVGTPRTTGPDGTITYENLVTGRYTVRELNAPDGYNISAELRTGSQITLTPIMSPVVFVNQPSQVTLQKQNEDGTPLAGATFMLEQYVGSQWQQIRQSEQMTTDTSGLLTVEGLTPGSYRFTETSAPSGYLLNTQSVPFTVTADANGQINPVTVGPFINYSGSLRFQKTDEQSGPLAGAMFEIASLTDPGAALLAVASASDGSVSVTGLAPGRYKVTEVTGVDGYLRNSTVREFEIPVQASGAPQTVTLPDLVNYKASARFVKLGTSGEALAGADFLVTKTSGTPMADFVVTSGADGSVLMDNLSPGLYRVTETNPPPGYVFSALPLDFGIPEEYEGQPPLFELGEFLNSPFAGGFELFKTDEENGAVLKDAWFELRDTAGNVVRRNLVTDANGYLQTKGLRSGDYLLVETQAPYGYLLDAEPRAVNIPYNPQGTPAQVTVNFPNQRYKGSFIVRKTDSKSGATLAGAQFELQDLDRKAVKTGLVTNRSGILTVSDLHIGDYLLVEVQAPSGYQLDSTPRTITIAYDPQGEQGAIDIDFPNEPTTTPPVTPGNPPSQPGQPEQPGRPDRPDEPPLVPPVHTPGVPTSLPTDTTPTGNYRNESSPPTGDSGYGSLLLLAAAAVALLAGGLVIRRKSKSEL
ncbi:MAG: SpaA isopeptide-forming pilin-related protein [Oscillospiraceae bacterium]